MTNVWVGGITGLPGVLLSAAAHAHCDTTLLDAQILPKEKYTMSHVKIVRPWEEGSPAWIPPEAEIRPVKGGGLTYPLFAIVCVNDYLLSRVQQDPQHKNRTDSLCVASVGPCKTFWARGRCRDSYRCPPQARIIGYKRRR